MNILFVLYGDFTSNSALHAAHLANELTLLSHECAITVPRDADSIRHLGKPAFRGLEYSEALKPDFRYSDGRSADIVHAWTTRENVRGFCDGFRTANPNARLVIHLEDHELDILESRLGKSVDELLALPPHVLDGLIPPHYSHPRNSQRFLQGADAATVIVERLRDLVPKEIPTHIIWPAADATHFSARAFDPEFRKSVGIPQGHAVLVYNGNVHEANAAEVRSLYLAVALLNQNGRPTRLIRTGRDFVPFLGGDDSWAREFTIDLGMVTNYQHLPAILALADYFVQPGCPGTFNDHRFPSKLPEFFAIGRPVILPATNLGLVTRHLEDAYVLDRADAARIAGAISHLQDDPALADKLTKGAKAFAARHFSWSESARRLLHLYREIAPHAAR